MKPRLFPLLGLLIAATLAYDAGAKPTVLSAKNKPESVCAEAYQPIAERYTAGLMFRLEKCGSTATNYIMGTMHHDDPAFTAIIRDAKALIRNSAQAGFELQDDNQTREAAMQYMFLLPTDPNGLESLLTQEEFATLATEVGRRSGIGEPLLRRMRPWAAALLVQYPPPKADGQPLDARLRDYATQRGASVFGLEKPEEQYDIFAAIPENKQLQMLKQAIADLPAIDEANAKLGKAYIARDLKVITQLADESFAEMEDAELRNYLKTSMIRDRNRRMAERSLPYLAQGNAFIAIGALHLLGEDGLLTLLEKEGYRISVAY